MICTLSISGDRFYIEQCSHNVAGMFDLNVPLNKVELHLLATLLDTANSDEIDYTELGNGLQHIR